MRQRVPTKRAAPLFARGVSPQAHVDPGARLEPGVDIEPGAVIGAGVEIGSGTHVGANATIGAGVRIGRSCVIGAGASLSHALIGDRVILHPGVRIGQDGFGFALGARGHTKVPQLGRVIIQDDVEIGANTTIDRARFGRTWIQEGVKIDNLVQIAHNVVIGKHSIIVAQVGIAGSVRIGAGVVIGGQAGIIGHIEIDDGTMIGAQSGVSKSLHGGTWWATPTVPLREAKEQIAWVRRLGKLFERVKALEEKLTKNPNESEPP